MHGQRDTLQGWNAYAKQGNTYRLRQRLTEWTTNELAQIAAEHKAQRNRLTVRNDSRRAINTPPPQPI